MPQRLPANATEIVVFSWSCAAMDRESGEHKDGFVGNPGADDAEREQSEDGEVSVVGQEGGDMGSELGHAVT